MSFFGGGFTQIPGLDEYLHNLQAEQYGDRAHAGGEGAFRRQMGQVARGKDIFTTPYGAGILNSNTNMMNQGIQRANRNIDAQFGPAGGPGGMGSVYNQRLKDQNMREAESDFRAKNDDDRYRTMMGLNSITQANAARQDAYTQSKGQFDLDRDKGALQGKIAGNQYHQGIGAGLLGGIAGGLGNFFTGGMPGLASGALSSLGGNGYKPGGDYSFEYGG